MAASEAVPTRTPPSPRSTMCRAAVRNVWNAPSRLTLSTRRHSSPLISRKEVVPRAYTPALAKQPSTRPSLPTVWAKAASTALASATSHSSASTLLPLAASSASAAAFLLAFVPQIATSAPAWTIARAMPRPMPLLPPVTRATLPVRSKGLYTCASLARVDRSAPEEQVLTASGKTPGRASEQEVALRHRERFGGLAAQQLAVRAHLVGFGIDLDVGRGGVERHRSLGNAATRVPHRHQPLLHAEPLRQESVDGRLAHERHRGGGKRPAESAKHGPVVHRLRCGNRGIGITHGRCRDAAAQQNEVWLHAEECRAPQHEIGALADLERAELVRHALGDGRVDGVLGDVALDAEIVVARGILLEAAPLQLHLVRRLPGADDDLANAPHGLTVRGEHRERAQIVQDVLRGDGFAPDSALCEGDVLGDVGVQVMTHHQHVEMLFQRVHREGARRVGGGGQHVLQSRHLDDVGSMAAASTLSVEGMDGATLEGRDGVLHEARLV